VVALLGMGGGPAWAPAAELLVGGGWPEGRRRLGGAEGRWGRSGLRIGKMRKRISAGGGLGVPRAASTVFCGMDSTELTSDARFELLIPARLSARFRMRSALPR
jgi:hypothetical protein